MTTVTIEELKERIDELVDLAIKGETVAISDGQHTVAEIVPKSGEARQREHIERLIREGTITCGPKAGEPFPPEFFTRELPSFKSGSVLEALLEEREEGW